MISVVLMFVVLYSRYKSVVLSGLIMVNIPLALVGAVLGLWLSGQPLSVAALIGFITLDGISVRNGILKVSHYINLMRFEGETFNTQMILRGSLERLSPVLMTALVTAFALAPLLFEAERPGTEVLHPVAVVIFFRFDQFHPAGHIPHTRHVLAVWAKACSSAFRGKGRRGVLTLI